MAPGKDPAATPVRVLPLDVVISVRAGEDLMAAARRQGLHWPTICNGDAACGVCYVRVEAGAEYGGPVGAAERATLETGPRAGDPRVRLACRLTFHGPAAVRKVGVRWTDSQSSMLNR